MRSYQLQPVHLASITTITTSKLSAACPIGTHDPVFSSCGLARLRLHINTRWGMDVQLLVCPPQIHAYHHLSVKPTGCFCYFWRMPIVLLFVTGTVFHVKSMCQNLFAPVLLFLSERRPVFVLRKVQMSPRNLSGQRINLSVSKKFESPFALSSYRISGSYAAWWPFRVWRTFHAFRTFFPHDKFK